MYLQITTRCNMSCAHCCFDCGPVGQDMSIEVFKKACEIANEYGSYISIGGGEPTLHPQFWEILGLSMYYQHDSDCPIWMATNGSITQTALALAGLAKRGAISCALSQDPFHDPIDPRVIQAFTKSKFDKYEYDMREIRNTLESGGGVSYNGRAMKEDFEHHTFEKCPCSGLFVSPDGKIWQCGCQEVQYGDVWNPQFPEDMWDDEEKYDGCSGGIS